MTDGGLVRRIGLGEDSTPEFKSVDVSDGRVGAPKKGGFADELAALANGRGGTVLLGVEDGTRRVPGTPPEEPTVFTIGHSNHPLDGFLALLGAHRISAVADVRSAPRSRFNPQFDREALAAALEARGVRYVFLGRELGGRPADPACYDEDGRVVYERVAETPGFKSGIARVVDGAARHRIALMCAEKEPLDCHRTTLVARALAALGVEVAHILADGGLEPHARALERLPPDLFEDPAGLRARRAAFAGGPKGGRPTP